MNKRTDGERDEGRCVLRDMSSVLATRRVFDKEYYADLKGAFDVSRRSARGIST